MNFQKAYRPFFALLISLIIDISSANADQHGYSDSLVRAAVIFGILRFTQWPDENSDSNEILLCTFGKTSSGNGMSKLESIPNIGGKTVKLKNLRSNTDFKGCHALIVGQGVSINNLEIKSTLLICDDCLARDNDLYAIRLMRNKNRIQFDINIDRVEQQNINLSASLIELAASCSSTNPNIRACND